MSYTEHPGSGTTPKASDTERDLLVKILLATIAGGGGGGGASGVYVPSGTDPNGTQTAQRPTFAYDDLGNFWVKINADNDNTGWVKIVSASAPPPPMAEMLIPEPEKPSVDLEVFNRAYGELEELRGSHNRIVQSNLDLRAKIESASATLQESIAKVQRDAEERERQAKELAVLNIPAPVPPTLELPPAPALPESRRSRMKKWLNTIKLFLLSFFAMMMFLMPMTVNAC